jgi:hypothetical protein
MLAAVLFSATTARSDCQLQAVVEGLGGDTVCAQPNFCGKLFVGPLYSPEKLLMDSDSDPREKTRWEAMLLTVWALFRGI